MAKAPAKAQRQGSPLQRTEEHIIWLKGRKEEEKILQTMVKSSEPKVDPWKILNLRAI